MKVILKFVMILAPVMTGVIFLSLKIMQRQEREWLVGDLSRRSTLISESINDYLVEAIRANKKSSIQKLLNRISKDERLTGALVCDDQNNIVSKSDAVPKEVVCDNSNVQRKDSNEFLTIGDLTLHKATLTIEDDGKTLGRVVILHDTSYMRKRHEKTEKYLIELLGALALIFFFVTLLVYRWSSVVSTKKLRLVFHDIIRGDIKTLEKHLGIKGESSALAKDLKKVLKELRDVKANSINPDNGPEWTAPKLRSEVLRVFGDSQICVIANREPYIHQRKGSKTEVLLPASGLVTAVEPIVRACSGLWIAHGSGSADKEFVDSESKLLVPPAKPEYVLKRVWLSRSEEQGYYYGFSNEGLWPLCHIAHTRPSFEAEDWEAYKTVNEKFANSFFDEKTGDRPILLIQDYHFALLPKLIREKRPKSLLSLFWHIPWPNPEAFGICPWKKELLEGMVGSDLLAFQTQFHCNNFLDSVDRFLEARVDREHFSVTIKGHTCFVKPFPISIEWPSRFDIPIEDFQKEKTELLSDLNLPMDVKIGVGVDRVDYTKGILERLRSIERFLDLHPEYVGKFVFIQIGAPSRTHIKAYQNLNNEVQELADKINWKFHNSEVAPIMLRLQHHQAEELSKFYRAADLCFVSSLHDGMNLVAKEYVSSRADLRGVLVLSSFAGASKELTEALIVNPYDTEECSNALFRALTMTQTEIEIRMKRLRQIVSEKNVFAWAAAYLNELDRISKLREATKAEALRAANE